MGNKYVRSFFMFYSFLDLGPYLIFHFWTFLYTLHSFQSMTHPHSKLREGHIPPIPYMTLGIMCPNSNKAHIKHAFILELDISLKINGSIKQFVTETVHTNSGVLRYTDDVFAGLVNY